jgi:hypothetical protein
LKSASIPIIIDYNFVKLFTKLKQIKRINKAGLTHPRSFFTTTFHSLREVTMFIKALFTLTLFGCSFFASANTYNLDQANPQIISYSAPGLSFDDRFTFTVPVNDIGAATAIKFDLSIGSIQAYAISDLMVAAVSPAPAASEFAFTALRDDSNAIIGYQSNELTAGSYEFDVSGKTAGLMGGNYAVQFSSLPTYSVSSVPLPGAVWLFGSAILGFTGFNRRKQADAK